MSEKRVYRSEAETVVQPEVFKSREMPIPEIDTFVQKNALSLHTLDNFIDHGEPLVKNDDPIVERYQHAVAFLEGKSSEELLKYIDPNGRFIPEQFSLFQLSVHPPGAIHIELGTPKDLQTFRGILAGDGGLGVIFSMIGFGDTREADSFAAQYFSTKIFGTEFPCLGVIVSVAGQFKGDEERKKALRHEYSHALVQEVMRPLCQRKIVDIDLHSSATDLQYALQQLSTEYVAQLAEHLGVLPHHDIPKWSWSLMIGKFLKEEQFLLDELRAYSFNFGPLPPKFQMTHLDLGDDDHPQGGDASMVKKYFEVWLLHTCARIISSHSKGISLATLGASVSLEQAKRLLEAKLPQCTFDPTEDDAHFSKRITALSSILSSKEYMDFTHKQGGELISQEFARQTLAPPKTIVDAEIARRWRDLDKADKEFQKSYKTIYS